MILQSMLGIFARAPEGLLTVNEPELPSWLGHVELRNIRVADARIGLAFGRTGDITSFSLLEREGDIRVTMQK